MPYMQLHEYDQDCLIFCFPSFSFYSISMRIFAHCNLPQTKVCIPFTILKDFIAIYCMGEYPAIALANRLRKCSREEIRDIALREENIPFLIEIADSGETSYEGRGGPVHNRRIYHRGWRTLWIGWPVRFDLDGQLLAIKALSYSIGTSMSEPVEKYLNSLLVEECQRKMRIRNEHTISVWEPYTATWEECQDIRPPARPYIIGHPNARGPLKKALCYRSMTEEHDENSDRSVYPLRHFEARAIIERSAGGLPEYCTPDEMKAKLRASAAEKEAIGSCKCNIPGLIKISYGGEDTLLDDQLSAIEALGYSQDRTALRYLESLRVSDMSSSGHRSVFGFHHPNVHWYLRVVLDSETRVEGYYSTNIEHPSFREAAGRINGAIRNLKNSLTELV